MNKQGHIFPRHGTHAVVGTVSNATVDPVTAELRGIEGETPRDAYVNVDVSIGF